MNPWTPLPQQGAPPMMPYAGMPPPPPAKPSTFYKVVGISLANTIVGTSVQLLVIMPNMYGRMGSVPMTETVQLFSTVSAIVGALVVAVPPIFTAIVLLRPAAKQELDE